MDQKLLQVPNALTIIRFFLSIPLVLFLHLESVDPTNFWNFLALIIFLFAVFTDKIDGYLARKREQITSFGKIMDPLADKLILISILIMLTQIGIVPGWITVIIFGRAIIITGLRGFAQSEGFVISASKWGKLKTFLQTSAVTLLLIGATKYKTLEIGLVILLIATIITVLSGAKYVTTYFSRKKGN